MSNGNRRQMSGADAMWLGADLDSQLMVIDAIMWTDEPLDWAEVRKVLEERLVATYPVFRQRPVESSWPWVLPSWEDDPDFRLSRHVHHARLRAPGDDARLQAFLEKKVSRPLDRDRPLWEMWFVDGYRGGSVVLSRFHHAMADGIALAQVMMTLTDPDPDAPAPEPAPEPGRPGGERPSLLSGAVRGVLSLPGLPVLGVRSVQVAQKVLLDALPRSVLNGKPGPAKRLTWSQPRGIDEVKRISRATDATVNDVLVAALSGALARYLDTRGQVVEHLTTMVPVNLRPLDRPLPRELGNKFALVLLHLPTGELEPLERLREVNRRMTSIKHSPESVITSAVAEGIGYLHAIERPFVDFFAAKAVGVTTNVAGPREPRYLAGRKVAGVLGWVPGSGRQTLGVCIYSYAGTVRIGFKVDARVVPTPELLVAAFDEELDALTEAVVAGEGPGDT
ncbi:wax ester/triacylglycerol synthase family O-acyltransferase [Nocardioides solisilvae]|uniref:wax ester/triacylglycerol synthase family O-acyltransferase n=1 Tax=Nocardioides solisilvae TaxID=1542435 RepID=UPI0019504E98|nr:wax ester/triacylglycerol synthase family O-acyltransferase [Nocardioides solisilvae]